MGSRIAVMKDGRIEQTGTPEGIVLRPETEYVARFVSSISTLRYLSAAEIMSEGPVSDTASRFGPSTPLAAHTLEVDDVGRSVGRTEYHVSATDFHGPLRVSAVIGVFRRNRRD